jgi:hypothetical protein
LVEGRWSCPKTEKDLEDVVDPGGKVEEGDEDADKVDRVRRSKFDVPYQDPDVKERRQGHDGNTRIPPHHRLFDGGKLVVPRQKVQAAEDDRGDRPCDAEVDFVSNPIFAGFQVGKLALPAPEAVAVVRARLPALLVSQLFDGPDIGVSDFGGEADILRLLEPQEPAEEGTHDIGNGGDLEWTGWQVLMEAGKCLNEEPERLHQGDGLGKPVLLRVLLDSLHRYVDQMKPTEFDDCIDMLHLQRLGLISVMGTPATGARSDVHEEAAHIVVKGLCHVPVRVSVTKLFAELVDVSEKDPSLQILCHGNREHDLGSQCVGRYPTQTRPGTTNGAVACVWNIEMQ